MDLELILAVYVFQLSGVAIFIFEGLEQYTWYSCMYTSNSYIRFPYRKMRHSDCKWMFDTAESDELLCIIGVYM